MSSLRDLGLSEYEARAYESLLETGPTTAKELSEESGVPMGRIYDVLSGLESQDLVRSQSTGRPKKYAPVEPETALDRLVEERKRELEERASQYEEVAAELAHELTAPEHPDSRFWTAAVGPEDSIELLLERLEAADDRIVLVGHRTRFDYDQVGNPVAAALVDAAERGVDVSVLLSPEMVERIPEDVLATYPTHLDVEGRLETRVSETVEGNVTVLDRREVCVEMPNPVRSEEVFAVVDLKDESFAADVHEEFEETWVDAEPMAVE